MVKMFENELTKPMENLTIKFTKESEERSSTFLDVLIVRDDNLCINTRWWQKECSAKRILNFHSYHPLEMKKNVVSEYIRHAIYITSPEFMHITIKNLRTTLRRSSYPMNFTEPIIKRLMGQFGNIHVTSTIGYIDELFNFEAEINSRSIYHDSTLNIRKLNECNDKQKGKQVKKTNFISFPLHNMKAYYDVKGVTKKNHIGCKIAPRTMLNNKKIVFASLKDKASLTCVRFAIFSLNCRDCNFHKFFRTCNLDLWRSAKHHFYRINSPLTDHMNKILRTPQNVRKFFNPYDLKIAFSKC